MAQIIRLIVNEDYENYTKHIGSDITQYMFGYIIQQTQEFTDRYIMTIDNEIVASGNILFEHKMTHGSCLCAHIEDILVSEKHRGNGYCKILMDMLIDIAKRKDCYRVDLKCSEELTSMYRKSGFNCSDVTAMYLRFP